MDDLNRRSIELVDEAMEYASELGLDVETLGNDGTVVDFGVNVRGGNEAGLLLTEIQTAGLAAPQIVLEEIEGVSMPYIELVTDHPVHALLGAQKAGWELEVDGFSGLGSGPARALVGEEREFQYIEESPFSLTALAIETDQYPDASVVETVAEQTGVEPSGVFLLPYASASVAGSVSNAARIAEIAVFRLMELGYDPRNIVSAIGKAPVAPVAETESVAIARFNDAIAYGGTVHLTVTEAFDDFDTVVSTAADREARPFTAIFEDHDWEFSAVPPELLGPARITIDVIGGETRSIGTRSESVLSEAFGLV